jgi:phospholipid/cholesterol/gamma-HCH transport system substrate-binding protein
MVGLAALIAFLLFLGFTFLIRGNLFGAEMEVNVLFERVSGLEVGSPVYIAGVYAGEVTSISYRPQHMGKPVVVTLGLNRDFALYSNATVRIVQSGLIGDKRVELDPGTPEKAKLQSGEAVVGEPQFDVDQALRKSQAIVDDLAASIRSLRTLITDEANLGAVRNTIQALEESIGEINVILKENRENLRETTANLRTATERMNTLIESTQTAVDRTSNNLEETQQAVVRALDQFEKQATRGAEQFEQVANRMESTLEETRTLVANTNEKLAPAFDNAAAAAESLNQLLVQLREGKGTLGRLINDPSPFVELDRLLRGIRQALLGGPGTEVTIRYEDVGAQSSSGEETAPSPAESPSDSSEAQNYPSN